VVGISTARFKSAAILVLLLGTCATYLYKNFDPSQRTLKLMGQTWQLGEVESENEGSE
jgi:hypothetical protein